MKRLIILCLFSVIFVDMYAESSGDLSEASERAALDRQAFIINQLNELDAIFKKRAEKTLNNITSGDDKRYIDSISIRSVKGMHKISLASLLERIYRELMRFETDPIRIRKSRSSKASRVAFYGPYLEKLKKLKNEILQELIFRMNQD